MSPYLLLLLQIPFIVNTWAKVIQNITVCHDKTYNHSTRSVDVPLGSIINLACHFWSCKMKQFADFLNTTLEFKNMTHEQDDFQAKLWYFRKVGKFSKQEIISDISGESEECKIDISPSHTLHLKHFDANDSGIYFCEYFGGKNVTFTYVLDGIYDITLLPKEGTSSDWFEFQKNAINATNNLIRAKKGSPLKTLPEYSLFPFEIVFLWSNWGPCEYHNNENIRKRTGKCRLRPIRPRFLEMFSSTKCHDEKLAAYLFDITSVSCRSLDLNSFCPKISRITRNVPDFIMKESCYLKESSSNKENVKNHNKLKYNVTKRVAENGYLILTCPEIMTESEIDWYKDNTLLDSSFRNNMAQSIEEPHLTIDAYNALYILHATKADEGIYSCSADGRNMQDFHVKVVTKSRFLNQDFIRYSIYLGFVLSLTVTCYCAGICVAWHRRASFADPLYLMNKKYCYSFDEVTHLLKD